MIQWNIFSRNYIFGHFFFHFKIELRIRFKIAALKITPCVRILSQPLKAVAQFLSSR